MKPPENSPAYSFSLEEVAARTGLGRTSVFHVIRDGRLIARKCGRRTIVLRSDLEAFLQSLESAR